MKPASRPQYERIKRIVDMVREGSEGGCLPNRGDFRRELEVSPRTLARDLDFLRDEERAPIEYDAKAHGYRLTDEGYRLPPVRISRKEAFGITGGEKPMKVRLLFEPRLAVYISERQWHPTQVLKKRRDGRIELRMETTGRKELVRWVLSWMPDVRVLAPNSLCDRIALKLEEGLRRNGGSVWAS